MKTVFHNSKSRHPEVKAAVAHLVLLVLALGAEFGIKFVYESFSQSFAVVIMFSLIMIIACVQEGR